MRTMAAYVLAVTLAMIPAGAHAQIEVLDISGGARPEANVEDKARAPAEDSAEISVAAEVPDALPPICGTSDIAIAEMGWPSAAILAHIHALLLQVEYECSIRLVPGEPESTLSSMATTQQPAVAPELWVSRQAEVWNGAMQAGSARAASPSFTGGPLEAWFVPSYVIQNNPGLSRVTDLMEHWRVFVTDGAERARLLSCPSDWACSIINRNMAAGLGLDARFDIVVPSDRFMLDGQLADAVARREPVLSYYWQPNPLIDQLGLVSLDMGPFDPGNAQCMAIRDCVPFGGSGFAPDTVVIAVAEWVFTEIPDIADYFARAAMPLAEMNRLLAWQAEHEVGPDAVAQHFLITGRDIWRPWLGQDVASADEEGGS